jgi:hypothetical protein
VAGATGLEPATSGVTGQRCNQLYYAPANDRCVTKPDELRKWFEKKIIFKNSDCFAVVEDQENSDCQERQLQATA